MTANKPEVKRFDCTSGGSAYCYGCYTMSEDEGGEYVEWEDYEALQAECERLREALEDISGTHHHSANAGEYFAKVAREALAAHRKGDAS